jgi:hypothetical protein
LLKVTANCKSVTVMTRKNEFAVGLRVVTVVALLTWVAACSETVPTQAVNSAAKKTAKQQTSPIVSTAVQGKPFQAALPESFVTGLQYVDRQGSQIGRPLLAKQVGADARRSEEDLGANGALIFHSRVKKTTRNAQVKLTGTRVADREVSNYTMDFELEFEAPGNHNAAKGSEIVTESDGSKTQYDFGIKRCGGASNR